jgi:hypothetical protein
LNIWLIEHPNYKTILLLLPLIFTPAVKEKALPSAIAVVVTAIPAFVVDLNLKH